MAEIGENQCNSETEVAPRFPSRRRTRRQSRSADEGVLFCGPMDKLDGLREQVLSTLAQVRAVRDSGSGGRVVRRLEVQLQQCLGTLAQKPNNFGAVLRSARLNARLSQQGLADLAGLSDRTVKYIEKSAVVPRESTLQKLYGVPGLRLGEHLVEPGAAADTFRPNSWFAPRYEPAQLMRDLVDLVNGPSAALEQTALYLDTRSATEFLELVQTSPVFRSHRGSAPYERAAQLAARVLDAPTLVVNALGSGDGASEVRFVAELASARPGALRLQLLDISHTLICVAHQHAVSTLKHLDVEVLSLHANFHDLARYPVLHQTAGEARVYLLLGATVANLDNENRFFADLHRVATPGDLLVLDFQLARAAPEDPELIRKLEPPLAHGPAQTHYEWLTGPFRRHCREARAVSLAMQLDTNALVPGSYELDCVAKVSLQSGPERQFLVWRLKRYQPARLAEHLAGLGWVALETWEYAEASALMVLRRV